MLKKLVFILSAVLVLLVIFAHIRMQKIMQTPLAIAPDAEQIFEVAPGSGLHRVIRQLAHRGWVEDPRWITFYARLYSRGQRIFPGEYKLDNETTPLELLTKLENDQAVEYPISFIEGWTLYQAVEELQRHEKLVYKVNYSIPGDGQQLHKLLLQIDPQAEFKSAEGLIFPSTYRYRKGMSDLQVLQTAYKKMQQVLDQEWQDRDAGLPYETPYEALIMASIVEKESAVAEEREEIAGVFVRRLQRGMRLQTDPTVIYGLGAKYKGNITRKHLKQTTPFNTYRVSGLPPTPIALAGRAAIHAALHPSAGDTLYFVAKGDGTHYFSATIEEHNKAVNEYQKFQRKKNYRSTPEEASNAL